MTDDLKAKVKKAQAELEEYRRRFNAATPNSNAAKRATKGIVAKQKLLAKYEKLRIKALKFN